MLAEKACQELESPKESKDNENTAEAEIKSLQNRILSMEAELEESFAVVNDSFSENANLKKNVADLTEMAMTMTAFFKACGVFGADDLSEAESCDVPESSLNLVTRVYEFLAKRKESFIKWINDVSYDINILN